MDGTLDRTLPRLAVFTGEPTFPEPLHVGRPNVGDRQRFLELINGVLDRRWFTNAGPLVGEFEKRICDLLKVRHCVSMCNGTVALEIAARAVGFSGEVIVPSFTFVATAHALQWQGITPVFCDIDPATHNIDPEQVESLITPRTTGIIGVHLWGRPCDVDSLQRIADRKGLRLMFDAAHALGCTHRGKPIGGFGEAEVLSFHATKFVNAFEGGAVVTNNDELAEKMRLMRNFGFQGYDNVVYLGSNGNMCEPAAAMGLCNLDALEHFVEVNRRNYHAYSDGLSSVEGIEVARYDETEANNYQYVIAEVDEGKAGLPRDALIWALHAENVLARRYFFPGCHGMEPYRSYFPNASLVLPHTQALADRVLSLPTGTSISVETVHRICDLVRTATAEGPRIRAAYHDSSNSTHRTS